MTNRLAQITNPILPQDVQVFQSGTGVEYVSRLISVAVTLILVVGSLYFIFMLLTGGVEWIRAGGDKTSLESARTKLVNAVIGLVLLFSAWAIFTLIESIFGVDLLLLDIPTLLD